MLTFVSDAATPGLGDVQGIVGYDRVQGLSITQEDIFSQGGGL